VVHGRSSLDSPLAGMMVVLASENRNSDEFKQIWLDVLEAAGCNVLTRLPPRSSGRKHCLSMLCLFV